MNLNTCRCLSGLICLWATGFASAGVATAPVATTRPVLTPNTFVPMNEPSTGVQMLGGDEIRYCPDLDGVLFYGGYRSFTSENQNALWLYRFAENRWRLLDINLFLTRSEMSSDGGHTAGRMVWDANRNVLVYGGLVSMSRNDRHRTWIFDPLALVGWDANPTGPTPNISFDACSAYLPERKLTFTYSAERGSWTYDAMANAWKQLTLPGMGPPHPADMVYDAKRHRLLAFGGGQDVYSGRPFKTYNDTWVYDLSAGATRVWERLPTTNPPPGRAWPQMAVSGPADIMLLCGGLTGEMTTEEFVQYHDAWVLHLDTLQWEQLPEANPPSPGPGHGNHLAYDPANNVFLYLADPARNPGYGYPCGMYAFKYGADAPDAKPAATAAPRPYDLNRLPKSEGLWETLGGGPLTATSGWALRPSLAAHDNNLILTFGEYPPPGNWGNICDVYAFMFTAGQWKKLGDKALNAPGTLAQTPVAAFDAAGKPVIAYQSVKPYAPVEIAVKRFDSDWKPIPRLKVDSWAALPALVGGNTLAIAWQHHPDREKNIVPQVAELNPAGDAWQPVAGGAPLNAERIADARAQFVALARDNKGRMVAAWQEQKANREGSDASPLRLRLRRIEDGWWSDIGGEFPISSTAAQDFSFAMTIHEGEPVVAACDGTDGGRGGLLVYAWKTGQWNLLGNGVLNLLGPNGAAFKPAMASDGASIYIAWTECLTNHPPLLFVRRWDGLQWHVIGAPLNLSPGHGAAHTPSIAILNGKPVVAWTEYDPEGDAWRQVVVKAMK